MAEPKPPNTTATPQPPPTVPPGGSGDAFDLWPRGALHSLFGAVAAEPIPEGLRRLVAGDAPGGPPPSAAGGVVGGHTAEAGMRRQRWQRRQTEAKREVGSPKAGAPHPSGGDRPAHRNGSGRDLVGRLRAAVASIRRQLSARRRNRV